ncbi:sugar phosphate isomerase/epimerase family protein [Acidicapsa ligni]|uniref:sugar phosphate isomerase/epimerase family protein n=1 Tax=Acidicapsa ligni TaxID=542300 RepID=UPI00295ACE46|nr:sugar phosphate isomerase/epimerase [Acidicapsa ligni]
MRAGVVVTAAACAFSAGESGAAAVTESSAAEPRIRLGVASYSFHKFDRAHVIEFMKQLNVKYLNAKDANDHLPMKPPEATLAAVDAYKAAGIELTGAGVVYFSKDEADVREKFEYCKRAGLSLIVGSPVREALPVVERFVKQYDMRLAIHNHGPEDKEWPSPLDILKEIEPMDKRIGLCIDVGHTARTGTDVVQAIHTAGARVFDLHMKDLADMKVKESQVAVGDGKMPVRGIFEALHAIGYKGFVDLEYEIHDDDPLPGMMKSFAYMRGVLAGMRYSD